MNRQILFCLKKQYSGLCCVCVVKVLSFSTYKKEKRETQLMKLLFFLSSSHLFGGLKKTLNFDFSRNPNNTDYYNSCQELIYTQVGIKHVIYV